MRRRSFLASSLALGIAPAVASGGRGHSIYMVTWRGRTEVERGFMRFWQAHAVGEERNARFTWRDGAQDLSRIAAIRDEIVRERPDLVYSWGTPATVGLAGTAVQPHPLIGAAIPMVFALVADIAGAGLAGAGMGAREVRDITGVSHMAPADTQVAMLRRYRPARAIGAVFNPAESNSVSAVAALKNAAEGTRTPVIALPVRLDRTGRPTPAGIDLLISDIAQQGANWLYLGPDSFLYSQIEQVAAAALTSRLSTFSATEAVVMARAPVLTGLVSRYFQVGQFAAHKALQRLRGVRGQPAETLKRFSFVVRSDVARLLGAYPPLSMIDSAEFVAGPDS